MSVLAGLQPVAEVRLRYDGASRLFRGGRHLESRTKPQIIDV
jgi:hypothetical protein